MATDFSSLTVAELRHELKQRNLPQNGRKADLIDRLNDFERDQAASENRDDPVDDNHEARDSPHEQAQAEPQSGAVSDALQPSIAEAAPKTPIDNHDIDDKSTALTAAAKLEQDSAPTKDAVSEDAAAKVEDVAPKVEDPAPKVEGAAPKAEDADAIPATEIITDAVSRKRRSRSPPPETESSRKRARPSEQTGEEEISGLGGTDGQDSAETQPASALQTEDSHAATRDTSQYDREEQDAPTQQRDDWRENREPTPPQYQERKGDTIDEPMTDYDRDVAPALHPATSALYIKNFMRPLKEPVLLDYLTELASVPGAEPDPNCVVDFYLDPIRSHALVSFTTVSAASRVRTALHGTVWPNESNRKELWVDFIPEDKVVDWIDREKAEGGRGSRWEVHYEPDDNGNIMANLVNAEMEPVRRNSTRQPLGPPPVPSGPARGFPGVEGAPLGPRGRGANHYRQAPPPPPAPASYSDRDRDRDRNGFITTRAGPPLQYRPVPEELAERRLANLKSHITKDRHRDLGRPDEINRYTFEEGDLFVDRGKEAFIGIRPPHRERERRRMGLGRGGGGPRGGPPPPPPRRRTPSPRGGGRDDYDRYRDRDRDFGGRDRFRDDVPRSRFDGQPLPTYTGGGGRGGRRGGGRRDRY